MMNAAAPARARLLPWPVRVERTPQGWYRPVVALPATTDYATALRQAGMVHNPLRNAWERTVPTDDDLRVLLARFINRRGDTDAQ